MEAPELGRVCLARWLWRVRKDGCKGGVGRKEWGWGGCELRQMTDANDPGVAW